MAGDDKPRYKKRGLIRMAVSLIFLAILAYIAVMLFTERDINLPRLPGIFSSREPVEVADEYHFDVGRNRAFTMLDGHLAAAGTLGIQVLDPGGRETLKDSFRMSSPAINTSGGRAIAFDAGGTAVRVFNETQVTASLETRGAIISASINRNGWFCVCTQESGGFRGTVTVYNNRGRDVYRVSLASGYVLSASISPDNRTLAVLNLTDEGSRISIYDLNSESERDSFTLPDSLILDMWHLPNGEILAVATDSLLVIDRNNTARELFGFFGRRLRGYTHDGSIIALHLLDYGVGYRGRLVALDTDGTILGERDTDREIISMSLGSGYLAILRSDAPVFYSRTLEELPMFGQPGSMAGATRILVIDAGTALAAGDHTAVVYKTERSAGP
jgi:hypothetical protein